MSSPAYPGRNETKKVLMVSSVSSMIDKFNMSNICLLQQMGYQVDVACNFENTAHITQEEIRKFKYKLTKLGIDYYQIDFERNVFHILKNLKAYIQLIAILTRDKKYEFMHCHSPIGGFLGRIAGHKTNTKVIYTAHGFHFYKGAPMINWIIYYPIERVLSRWTDILITINREDYECGKRFHCKAVKYVPGVGVDHKRFSKVEFNKLQKLRELDIPDESKIILSVGELNKNKNQQMIIQSLAEIKNPQLYYLICGMGSMETKLKRFVKELKLERQVKFLGYVQDVEILYNISDIFVFPSRREGLPVALMEAMACSLPIVCSNIRGNIDLVRHGVNGYLCKTDSVKEYCCAITDLLNNNALRKKFADKSEELIKPFSLDQVNQVMANIYNQFMQ